MRFIPRRLATICLLVTMALLVWRYYSHVWQQTQQRLTSAGFAEHNFSDLYPCWLGAREALLRGHSPYSDEVTREIQRGYYGRPIDPNHPGDPVDEQRFVYPFYIVFFLVPLLGAPFDVAQVLFTVVLAACVMCSVFFWVRGIDPHASGYRVLLSMLLAVATIPFVVGLSLQQMSVPVAFLIAAVVAALRRNRFIVAGLLLAGTTIKPQLSILFVGFVLFWSVSQWKLRRRVALSFVCAIAILVGASLLMQPRWPVEFLAGLGPYVRYTHATTGLRLLLGRGGEIVALVALVVMVGMVIVRARSASAASADFAFATALILALTCVAIPSLAPHNQVLLLLGYILLANERHRLWQRGRIARALSVAAWLALAWPFAAATFSGAALILGKAQWAAPWQVVLATNPLIPIALLAALVTISRPLPVPPGN